MWIELGHFSAILALVLAVIQTGTAFVGGTLDRPVWVRVSRQAALVGSGFLTLAMLGLQISFLTHDFSVQYVAGHASLDLPFFYLATALWGGHEGSLLLWGWLLSVFGTIAVFSYWRSQSASIPWVLVVFGCLVISFLCLVLFLSSPFDRLIPPPMDGRDLNPLLQDPGMVFHPPFLYMGYVGFAVPYAFAISALIRGRLDDQWIRATRRWSLFAWAMLTVGIVFGANWAYYELGWGGYWAWDPVENASFMPWLTATAFLHSVMVQERSGQFRIWNLMLIITTFALSLLGTFLVRSGVLSSVHAFANDPGRGVYILGFMSVLLLVSFGLLTLRGDALKSENRLDGVVSREVAFLFNNLFFMVAMLTVLLGTLYPLAVETFSNAKVTVGAPYYNKVFLPIMFGILLLMGIGAVIPWRRASAQRMIKLFRLPLIIGFLALPLSWYWGVDHPYGIGALFLILFVITSHGGEIIRSVRARVRKDRLSPLTAFVRLISRNRRRYGGFVVHAGLLVMVAGFIGSGLFQEEQNLVMKPGETVRIGAWTLTLDKIHTVARENWEATEAVMHAQGRGEILTLRPQKRVYNEHSMPTTEASIHTTIREDLYVILGDAVGDGWHIRVFRNPLVVWVWIGALIMGLGVLIAFFEKRIVVARKTVREAS
ncbi:MAG: heme lyase CcmF/NrfE family subunit [Magnetococcales bacterium]|nr:heme lyase CcmF/NrfE family subunit [Magnetococcales bacterium]